MDETITKRLAKPEDHSVLDEIRKQAFAPVFSSFRNILGEEIYTRAQEPEDLQQAEILTQMFQPDSTWQLFVVEKDGQAIGFFSIELNVEAKVGEIGLNAVHPDYAGKGVGSKMYALALQEMKLAGIRVATVATGGDVSHDPARKAYKNAGFDVEIPSVWMCKVIE